MSAPSEISLLEYWAILKRNKLGIAGLTMIATALAVLISLLLPKTFKSSAVLMPMGGQKNGGSIAAAVSQMGFGSLLGGFGAGGSNSAQIMAILKSRTLAEKVIEKADLMPVLFPEQWDRKKKDWKQFDPSVINQEEAVNRLLLHVSFLDDKKNQTISIDGEFPDPKDAAKAVNAYVEELASHINRNTFTMAKRNRIFIEGQLERNKADLLKAGKELASFYYTNRVSNSLPSVNVDVSIDSPSSTVEPSPSVGSGDKTEDLQRHLDELNKKIEQAHVVTGVPQQVYLQYLTLRQELLGKINALLTHQYELAKVEENKDDLTFQIIDPAYEPIKRFKPKRRQIVVMTFVMSLFLSLLYALGADYIRKMKKSGSSA